MVQVVICAGKEASRMARPKWAGLKILLPKPPKICLPITTAQKLPKAARPSDNSGGRQNASSRPVKRALPSPTVIGLCMSF